jgi:hypothetical protein
MPNVDVPAAESGLPDDFHEKLRRLERDLTSMKSASETVWKRGRALIDRLKNAERIACAPSADYVRPPATLVEFVDRLNELTNYVECGWLAARGLGDEHDNAGLSVALGRAVVGLRELSKDFESGRRSSAPKPDASA